MEELMSVHSSVMGRALHKVHIIVLIVELVLHLRVIEWFVSLDGWCHIWSCCVRLDIVIWILKVSGSLRL